MSERIELYQSDLFAQIPPQRFDLIVAMDDENFHDLSSIDPGQGARLVRMCDYCRQHDVSEVPDPYYGGPSGFERVFDLVEAAAQGLLDEVRQRHLS